MKTKINKEFIENLYLGRLLNFDSEVESFAIDSRKIQKNMGFVALSGENTDGHNYIQDAYQNGASLIIIARDWWQEHHQVTNLPVLITEDPQRALQKIATEYRKTFSHPVLCVTGSNGKTTTVNMIAKALSKKYNVHTTIGNYNNQLGVPLSILSHQEDHDFSVLELGTNHFGEIEFLAKIAQPTAGLITNIGLGHVEYFKNRAGVAKAKEELFTSLPEDGLAFINSDDQYIRKMTTPEQQVSFGFTDNPDYKAKILNIDQKARYSVEINKKHKFRLPISGESFAKNAIAAFAVCAHFDIYEEELIEALEKFTAVNSRLKIIGNKYTVIDDSYNANPDSTKLALNTLAKMETTGKKIFVFGDMLELGENSEKYHREIGNYANQIGVDLIFTYGNFTYYSYEAARNQGLLAEHFSSKAELIKTLKKRANKNDIILIKGSRGNKMEDIVREVT